MSRTTRKRNKNLYCYDELVNRDKKDPTKASSKFKKFAKKERRAKEKNALKHIQEITKENIPKFKKTNDYFWN